MSHDQVLFFFFHWITVQIQLFQLTLSDQSFKPTQQDRMVVWVEAEPAAARAKYY